MASSPSTSRRARRALGTLCPPSWHGDRGGRGGDRRAGRLQHGRTRSGSVSIDRGLDPREFTLVSFGGAGSLHAAALAEIIGIREVLVPIHQGVFSAFGLMTADMRVDESSTASLRSDLVDARPGQRRTRAAAGAGAARLASEGYRRRPRCSKRSIEMRYLGQNYSTDIAVPLMDGAPGRKRLDEVYTRFHAEHARLYGYEIPDEIIEFVHFKVTADRADREAALRELFRGAGISRRRARTVYFRSHGWLARTPIYGRTRLPPGGPSRARRGRGGDGDDAACIPASRSRSIEYGNLILTTAGRPIAERSADDDRSGHSPGRQQLPRDDGARDGHRDAQHRPTRRSSTRGSTSRARSSTSAAR